MEFTSNSDGIDTLITRIRDRVELQSEQFLDERFAEEIDRLLPEIPHHLRDEFMLIALSHGYRSPAERAADIWQETDGFDASYYDGLFPFESTKRKH